MVKIAADDSLVTDYTNSLVTDYTIRLSTPVSKYVRIR